MKHLILKNAKFIYWHIEFYDMIKTVGYSNGRETSYPSNVREFLHFLEKKEIIQFQDVNNLTILEYYQYICNRPNNCRPGLLSQSSIGHQLQALRLFFDYLLDCKEIEYSPTRIPKFRIQGFNPRNIVTVEEIKQIFRKCKTLENKSILCCAYGCGLRRNEIYRLNTADINFHNQTILVRVAKGGKSRVIPLSDKVKKYLKCYLSHRRADIGSIENSHTPLFINKSGFRLSGARMNDRLKEIIKGTSNLELIEKKITLHCLRHSIAVHLMDNGASIEFVQTFLGHSDIDTTNLYAIRRKRKSSIVRAFRY